ncbi:hypothetical protein BJ138DRAFT_1152658 [Hygrophoropsis aurantiaca]|uniref:Uncharacterized protein n=1 Tax=Hygrophoropsis aurantiaca TaxID=72124 RepID=A0ACB8ABF7_9AGAM|nr:hypothetical protein BJ138DRAFT_1152658 [Hygrophoropsis aurantiaca]
MSSGISKITAERNQRALLELVMKPGNDICADCKSRNPRWASFNLGIFVCVHCASIHRKLGTHITKVKSLTLDQWSKEQLEVMKQNGNVKVNSFYNPDETRHPPPTNMIDSERDSELEKFIRAKYEFKRFVDRSASRLVPPARSSSSNVSRPRSTPIPEESPNQQKTSVAPPPLDKPAPSTLGRGTLHPARSIPSNLAQSSFTASRSASQPVPSQLNVQNPQVPAAKPSGNQVWDDLISLQTAPHSSSLPLQFQSPNTIPSLPAQPLAAPHSQPSLSLVTNAYSNLSTTPGSNFPNMMQTNSPIAMSPATGMGMSPGNIAPSIGNPYQQQHVSSSVPNNSFFNSQSLNPFPSSNGTSVPNMGMMMTGMPQFTPQSQFQPSPGLPPPSPIAQSNMYFQPQPHHQFSQLPQTPQQQFTSPSHIPQQQYSPLPPQPQFSLTPQIPAQQYPSQPQFAASPSYTLQHQQQHNPQQFQQQQMFPPNQYGSWQQNQ